MDRYTTDTQRWLDRRFRQTDPDGVYFAHQPIYGFRQGHSEAATISRYSITYSAMRALGHLAFETLLDVGGAEGYKAALTRSLFGAQVRVADLSQAACDRAKALYDIDGDAVDILRLPYDDNSFDVVLCSETLEHVPDIEAAASELLRVSKRAVVITVPHESRRVVERHIRSGEPHAHIHSLNSKSFSLMFPGVPRVITTKAASTPIYALFALAEGMPRTSVGSLPGVAVRLLNAMVPVTRRVFPRRSIERLIAADEPTARYFPFYRNLTVTLLKDVAAYSTAPRRAVSVGEVLEFSVPLHRLSPPPG